MIRPFYLDKNNTINFPRREIYNSADHEIWFRDEGIPTVGVIRGYFHEDHISVFINDYDIPPLHPAVIMDWFNTYKTLSYVELGANRIKDEYSPKLVIFKGKSVKFKIQDEDENEESEESKENLIDESSELDKKESIGFKKDENNSTE